MQRQDLAEERLGGREVLQLLEKDRHVEMHPPFGAAVLRQRLERLREVEIAGESPVLERDHLVEIDRLVEGPSCAAVSDPTAAMRSAALS